MFKYYLLAGFALQLSLFTSCKQSTITLTTEQASAVKDSVLNLAAVTENDVSARGPVAWLDHFENSPEFFMVNDGSLVFKDYHSADIFIRDTFVKQLQKIDLKWTNIRIDPLTPDLANMAADYHENLTITPDKVLPANGYFTATVLKTSKGWQFRNAHWSSKPAK